MEQFQLFCSNSWAFCRCNKTKLIIILFSFYTLPAFASYKGHFKIGNPYQIEDKWYYPKVDLNYNEIGIASWYGPKFHRKKTANGEIFKKHHLTAAHPTLPIPSIVEVKNLENGKTIKVRVNDRGPFKKNRIIDMSEFAAKKLGFENQGTAKVNVIFLTKDTIKLHKKLFGKNMLAKYITNDVIEQDLNDETIANKNINNNSQNNIISAEEESKNIKIENPILIEDQSKNDNIEILNNDSEIEIHNQYDF